MKLSSVWIFCPKCVQMVCLKIKRPQCLCVWLKYAVFLHSWHAAHPDILQKSPPGFLPHPCFSPHPFPTPSPPLPHLTHNNKLSENKSTIKHSEYFVVVWVFQGTCRSPITTMHNGRTWFVFYCFHICRSWQEKTGMLWCMMESYLKVMQRTVGLWSTLCTLCCLWY